MERYLDCFLVARQEVGDYELGKWVHAYTTTWKNVLSVWPFVPDVSESATVRGSLFSLVFMPYEGHFMLARVWSGTLEQIRMLALIPGDELGSEISRGFFIPAQVRTRILGGGVKGFVSYDSLETLCALLSAHKWGVLRVERGGIYAFLNGERGTRAVIREGVYGQLMTRYVEDIGGSEGFQDWLCDYLFHLTCIASAWELRRSTRESGGPYRLGLVWNMPDHMVRGVVISPEVFGKTIVETPVFPDAGQEGQRNPYCDDSGLAQKQENAIISNNYRIYNNVRSAVDAVFQGREEGIYWTREKNRPSCLPEEIPEIEYLASCY